MLPIDPHRAIDTESAMPDRPSPTDRLALLLWGADPSRPELCATPFSVAAAAAAMDAEVEIHFAARSVTLLLERHQHAKVGGQASSQDIGWFMRQARAAGVRFVACHASMDAWEVDPSACTAWLDGLSGSTAFAARVLDPAWRTLVF